MKNILCLLIFLTITFQGHCQYGMVRFNYKIELEKRLFPKTDTSSTKVIALFVEHPVRATPEQSLRIIEKSNQSYIEVRGLNKNLWNELHIIKPTDSLYTVTSFWSTPISKTFRTKLLEAFSSTIAFHISTKKPKKVTRKTLGYQNGQLIGEDEVEGPDFFDGTTFDFRTYEHGTMSSTVIDCPLDSNDMRYKVSMVNLQIIDDIKKGSFDESKYVFR